MHACMHLRERERETVSAPQLERRLNALMGEVKEERSFGLFFCRGCQSRWRSGFAYPQVRQKCEGCGRWVLPFSLLPLLKATPLELDELRTQARKERLEERFQKLRLQTSGTPTNAPESRTLTRRKGASVEEWAKREKAFQQRIAAALEARAKREEEEGVLPSPEASQLNSTASPAQGLKASQKAHSCQGRTEKCRDERRQRGAQERAGVERSGLKSLELRNRLVSTLLSSQGLSRKAPPERRRTSKKA